MQLCAGGQRSVCNTHADSQPMHLSPTSCGTRQACPRYSHCTVTMQMGPSGSGKTTLLDVLAGRKTQGTIEGEVLFASQKPTINFIRRFTGYVEQFDTLLDILTVREMLLYTAEMKRPVKEKLSEKVKIVDHFVEKLNLTSCKDTTIGNNLNRCAAEACRAICKQPACCGRGSICMQKRACAAHLHHSLSHSAEAVSARMCHRSQQPTSPVAQGHLRWPSEAHKHRVGHGGAAARPLLGRAHQVCLLPPAASLTFRLKLWQAHVGNVSRSAPT